ncbi:regulatory protein, luxR family [Thermanaeromonas toyohensis ToBE]|uniref:Regulatory protein, luxR family n=1 Tax=Thermanaeromonas toyohensis ToBE TaxID=698762 RepID=A0A1W1VRR3_9FIRM|nr:sigma factor-like helix-turn-helix DNA-binding protein [Thermanaeromonas toyohensis]SMB96038.1 regulatory protein, luxR family [Thermanaeromonas toyohensis ToBE]
MANLTAMQERVLTLRSQGLGVKKIAEVLGLSESTVKTHLKRAQAKLSNPRESEPPPDDLQEILKELEPESSLTVKIEKLARRGIPKKIIAQLTGTTQATVRQIVHRQKKKEEDENNGRRQRERVRTYRLEGEEREKYKSLPPGNKVPDEAAFLYKIYVEIGIENLKPEALALLGTQGLGGWRGRQAVFRARKEMTHRLSFTGRIAAKQWSSRKVAEEIRELHADDAAVTGTPSLERPFKARSSAGTIKERRGNVWWALCEDLLEDAKRTAGLYRPRSWNGFMEELAGRVRDALTGLLIEQLGHRDGYEVYRVCIERTPAVAVRASDQGGAVVELVWEVEGKNRRNGRNGKSPKLKGTVVPLDKGRVALVNGNERMVVDEPAGVNFSARGKVWVAATLETGTTRLIRRGDVIEMDGGIARIVKWSGEHKPKVMEFSGADLAWAIAAYVVRKPCWLVVERPDEKARMWDFTDLDRRLAA